MPFFIWQNTVIFQYTQSSSAMKENQNQIENVQRNKSLSTLKEQNTIMRHIKQASSSKSIRNWQLTICAKMPKNIYIFVSKKSVDIQPSQIPITPITATLRWILMVGVRWRRANLGSLFLLNFIWSWSSNHTKINQKEFLYQYQIPNKCLPTISPKTDSLKRKQLSWDLSKRRLQI